MLRDLLTSGTLSMLSISIILNAIDVGVTSVFPASYRRDDTTRAPPPLCGPYGYCHNHKLELLVRNNSHLMIGEANATALTECAGVFNAVSYSDGSVNHRIYTRDEEGPFACACLAYCDRQMRDCLGGYTPFKGWALMLPAETPTTSCSCENARFPIESQPVCAPQYREESLIIGYIQSPDTCPTRIPPTATWSVWNAHEHAFVQAPLLLQCEAAEYEKCVACERRCEDIAPGNCTFRWPPRCSTDGTVNCEYECPGNASVSFTFSSYDGCS